ncbi:MAG: hypothetical protein ACRC42_00605, partial [Mycoplasma sp.]
MGKIDANTATPQTVDVSASQNSFTITYIDVDPWNIPKAVIQLGTSKSLVTDCTLDANRKKTATCRFETEKISNSDTGYPVYVYLNDCDDTDKTEALKLIITGSLVQKKTDITSVIFTEDKCKNKGTSSSTTDFPITINYEDGIKIESDASTVCRNKYDSNDTSCIITIAPTADASVQTTTGIIKVSQAGTYYLHSFKNKETDGTQYTILNSLNIDSIAASINA